ncbi:PfkB family carbohydrate kinase [Brevibacillus invocatus]|uniref:PfkB family carbohydrate kinase n=1 Tax=Brevibacillus invocatus TaxID=173959 RepID=UPI001FE2B2EC|nr:PfkB family carbohydrate kinase [Brevibacillus invocatus]
MPGANAQCIPADIDAQIELIERADIVLMQMEIPLATVTYAAKVAKLLQKTVILNPAPAQKLPPELLASVDYLTPNETELSMLAEGESDLVERMDALLKQGVRHVVATARSTGSGIQGSSWIAAAHFRPSGSSRRYDWRRRRLQCIIF